MRVVPIGTDRYGRLVARVWVGKLDLNYALVRTGYAWHYTRYYVDSQFAAAQEAARVERRGLWADPNPQAPWAWRKPGAP